MTRAAFKLAQMAGKMDKMGVLNPLLRQGLGHGAYRFYSYSCNESIQFGRWPGVSELVWMKNADHGRRKISYGRGRFCRFIFGV